MDDLTAASDSELDAGYRCARVPISGRTRTLNRAIYRRLVFYVDPRMVSYQVTCKVRFIKAWPPIDAVRWSAVILAKDAGSRKFTARVGLLQL